MQRLVVAGLDSKSNYTVCHGIFGLDHDFFDNEVHKQFAEWAMGYPYTPALKNGALVIPEDMLHPRARTVQATIWLLRQTASVNRR